MKQVYVSGLEPNENVTTQFLVVNKEIRQKKTGEPYLSLVLADRTGEIDAKMWDNVAEVMETFEKDDFIKVKGIAQVYQNRQQFTIHRLRLVDDSEADFADYFPASKRDPEEMFAELRQIIQGHRQRAFAGAAERDVRRPTNCRAVQEGSGGEIHPSCLPRRLD